VKNKQTDYKSDADESMYAPVGSSKKPKKQKIDPNSDLARLTREQKAKKKKKKKKKRAGTGNHPLSK
jgi:hypothetical protein